MALLLLLLLLLFQLSGAAAAAVAARCAWRRAVGVTVAPKGIPRVTAPAVGLCVTEATWGVCCS